jgi:hypothetical protein
MVFLIEQLIASVIEYCIVKGGVKKMVELRYPKKIHGHQEYDTGMQTIWPV